MADSASESFFQSDALGLRHISSSLFNIPGLFTGFSSRGSLDSESTWSPTSPLDFGFFSNLSNPFGRKSPRSPSLSGHKKKWDCSKVGLGIVNLLADETKPTGEVIDSTERKNIIFGPQVKTDCFERHNSLPKNSILPLSFEINTPNPWFEKIDPRLCDEAFRLETKPFINSSLTSSTPTPTLSSKQFCLVNRATTIASLPLVIGGSSQTNKSFDNDPSSLPIPIGSGNGFVRSLSAREIELSEDYTRIISHGPNPRTTHIFGDCVLDCHTNDLSNFGDSENLEIELPQEGEHLDGSIPYASNFLSFCYSCKKKLEKGDDIYIYRGEKAFCSFDCRSEGIFAEEETEKANNDSSKGSPGSSYHDDFFVMGMSIAA